MKIVCISDTHGKHQQIEVPDGDLLIHAGDISSVGHKKPIIEFLAWFDALPHKYKIFIGGNHDFLLDKDAATFRELLTGNYLYLENEAIEIEGIKIWGSPITPTFYDWAFMEDRGEAIKKYWDQIPDDIDILITHGPAYGIGDRTYSGIDVGCEELGQAILRVQPKYHIFGHIHEGYGMYEKEVTTFINACCLNLHYYPVNKPVEFEY